MPGTKKSRHGRSSHKKSTRPAPARFDFEAARLEAEKDGLGWRMEGLEDWPTDAIFGKLGDLTIESNPDSFREMALASDGPNALADRWIDEAGIEDVWENFPLLAAVQLWERLTPDIPCPEMIGLRLNEAIEEWANEDDPISPESAAILEPHTDALLDYLAAQPEESIPGGFDRISHSVNYDLRSFMLDYMEDTAGINPDRSRRIAEIMSRVEPENSAKWWINLALAHQDADRLAEAAVIAREVARRLPDNFHAQLHAGNAFAAAGDQSRSAACFERSVELAESARNWDWAVYELGSTLNQDEAAAEMDRIITANPRPPDPAGAPVDFSDVDYDQYDIDYSTDDQLTYLDDHAGPPEPYIAPPKTGPNEPCPCGSGKKYKKCCRG